MIGQGQKIEEILSALHVDSLKQIVGDDIVEIIKNIRIDNDLTYSLEKIAKQLIYDNPEIYFSDKRFRKLFHNEMSEQKSEELAKRLGLNKPEEVDNFDPTVNNEQLNIYLGFFGVDLNIKSISTVEPDYKILSPNYSLFGHQRDTCKKVVDILSQHKGKVVLHMPTGSGKTRTAMHIVSSFLNKNKTAGIIWLASSSELLEQAAEAFEYAWSNLGDRDISVTRMWGDYNPDLSTLEDGVLIAGFQKINALNSKDPLTIFRVSNNIKLIIVDEAHQSIAPTYRETIENIINSSNSCSLLGLTATPGRTWSDISEDEQVSNFYDNNKVMLEVEGWDDPISYLISNGYLAKPEFRTLQVSNPNISNDDIKDKDEYKDQLLDKISSNSQRNIVIINEILKLINEGHTRLILFSTSVRHAEIISVILLLLGINSHVVTGSTPLQKRNRIIKSFRSDTSKPEIICNYGVLTTGFDAPKTSAVIISRPTRSLVLYSQMVGRATRGPKAGGNKYCTISTIVDTELHGFGDITEAFTNWEDVWN